VLFALALSGLPAVAAARELGAGDFARDVRPLLERHCLACHSGQDAERGFDLEALADRADALDAFTKLRARLVAGDMPPQPKPRPDARLARGAIDWIDARFFRLANGAIDPGRPTLRRLTRTQYECTIRELFAVDYQASALFPEDDVAHGFDSIGEVLSTSGVLFEKALKAAEEIAVRALRDPNAGPELRHFGVDQLTGGEGNSKRPSHWGLYSNSTVRAATELTEAGEYVVRVRAWGQQAGPDPARVQLTVDGRALGRFDVTAADGVAGVYEARAQLTPGRHKFGAAFVNDYYEPKAEDPKQRDRNLNVEALEVEGPFDARPPTAFERRMLADPRADHAGRRRVLSGLVRSVWRRPATPEELGRLAELAPREASLVDALRPALVALLASPHFLFRVEADEGRPAPGGVRELDGYELATRLAFFLWSSAPDEALLDRAADGSLKQPEVLAAETERLLRDARSTALARDFAAQWLQIRALERVAPDPERFPAFDDELRLAMRTETELFFDALLRERRPVRELLEADFTFVNEELARHYGLEGVHGDEPRRVRLEPGVRNGLLGQGSILTVTSNPTRTSPVKRGKWVLDVLLGAAPPPPPPGVGDLDERPEAARAASLRERMQSHRAKPECASCHAALDPLGFGLENFDAVGAWREREERFAVDASGVWPDGREFAGPIELRAQIAADPRFLRNVAARLMVYALGRGLTPADDPTLDQLLAGLPQRDPTLVDLAHAVVRSVAFQKRRVGDR